MTKKAISSILITIISCLMLTGCCLIHDWQEATCTTPKTCRICGAKKGATADHILTEADYQTPQTCTVCGKTFGDVLTPAFIEYNVKGQFMKLKKIYDYTTSCNPVIYDGEAGEYKTTGKASVTDYRTFSSDDGHEAKEGYEWKTVEMQLIFSDENAVSYGFYPGECLEDYYDITGHDVSTVYDENGGCSFIVRFNGENYTECKRDGGTFRMENNPKDAAVTLTMRYYFLLPKGYDGIIMGLRDSSVPWEDGMYIFDVSNENTLFFRLQ